jgi:hypothetical protein
MNNNIIENMKIDHINTLIDINQSINILCNDDNITNNETKKIKDKISFYIVEHYRKLNTLFKPSYNLSFGLDTNNTNNIDNFEDLYNPTNIDNFNNINNRSRLSDRLSELEIFNASLIINNKFKKIKKKKYDNKKECIICFEDNNEFYKINKCNHEFCCKCLTKWFKHNDMCPLCRTKL